MGDGRVVQVGEDGRIIVEPWAGGKGGGRRRGVMEKGTVAVVRTEGKGSYVASVMEGEVEFKEVEGMEFAGKVQFGEEEELVCIAAGDGWIMVGGREGAKFVEIDFEDGKLGDPKEIEGPEDVEEIGVSCVAGKGGIWGVALDDGDVVVGRCEDGAVEVTKVRRFEGSELPNIALYTIRNLITRRFATRLTLFAIRFTHRRLLNRILRALAGGSAESCRTWTSAWTGGGWSGAGGTRTGGFRSTTLRREERGGFIGTSRVWRDM